jgi:cytochrome c-type biogenesis protein CcmH/NrfG
MLERLASFRRRAEASPDDPAAWNTWAWHLATCEPPGARDPAAAVSAAERAATLSQRRNPAILDTLATALFATGRTDEAIATGREALALVAPDDRRRAAVEQALARFVAGAGERAERRRPRRRRRRCISDGSDRQSRTRRRARSCSEGTSGPAP